MEKITFDKKKIREINLQYELLGKNLICFHEIFDAGDTEYSAVWKKFRQINSLLVSSLVIRYFHEIFVK